MKKVILPILLLTGAVLAQTLTSPQKVDWRFSLAWDDPQPPGTITNWLIVVSGTTDRTFSTRLLAVEHVNLLGGLPAGTYPITIIGQSESGTPVEPSTNHVVVWPGGNGKLKGATNLRSFK